MPSLIFKKIEITIPDHHICRTTPSKDFIHPVTGKPKDDMLCESSMEFLDYSTNLIGKFQLQHNYITLYGERKKYFRALWNFQEKVEVPQFRNDFHLDDSKGYFFLKIGTIHNVIKCPYSKLKAPQDYATAVVVHTPTRSNYWHFSIQWEDKDGIIINPSDSKWKAKLINSIRAALSEHFDMATPALIPLPKHIYCKN